MMRTDSANVVEVTHRPDEDDASQVVRQILQGHNGRRGGLIAILEEVQRHYGYLPEPALRTVARRTGQSLVDVYGVATFYRSFSLQPRGRSLISVCLGTACHGFCEMEPSVLVEPHRTFYPKLAAKAMADIIEAVAGGFTFEDQIFKGLALGAPMVGKTIGRTIDDQMGPGSFQTTFQDLYSSPSFPAIPFPKDLQNRAAIEYRSEVGRVA